MDTAITYIGLEAIISVIALGISILSFARVTARDKSTDLKDQSQTIKNTAETIATIKTQIENIKDILAPLLDVQKNVPVNTADIKALGQRVASLEQKVDNR